MLFAIALLASGVNSTVTATLAGQIVMEGFLRLRIPHWARRLITRAIAIIPVLVITALYGSQGTGRLVWRTSMIFLGKVERNSAGTAALLHLGTRG